jgi:molybdate transport system substrate-binding protein
MTLRVAFLLLGALSAVHAAELYVLISGGFSPAYEALAPEFERATGHKLITQRGPSMGETPQAIPNRLKRGESADVLIMVRTALDNLLRAGQAKQGSAADLALSKIGIAVKAGSPVPDIKTVDGLRKALLAAKSIAYSDSASGQYVATELFVKLGIPQAASKARKIEATPVAEIVASGEAEVGFQQLSELMAVKGVTLAGPIPEEVQLVTVYSAAIAANSKSPDAARQLIEFLHSARASEAIRKTGIEPTK